ncbi:Mut7-C RNAse domain-containing protein [Halobacteriaceae archaeon GCM10025711]
MPSPADTRLLVDVMCGRLATYLRMCGYDAAYALDRGVEADDGVLDIARDEGRTVVTRDVELAARADRSVLLRSRDVTDQLRELLDAGFALELTEPARCATCNGPLERLPDGGPTPDHAPDTDETAVWRCLDCGQEFWRGSHWDDVEKRLAELRD